MRARVFGRRVSVVSVVTWAFAASLVACGGGDETAPRNVTKQEARSKEERKDLKRARRIVKARKDNVHGGVELAAFAQQLQRSVQAGAREDVAALFLDPQTLAPCSFTRDKGAVVVELERIREHIQQRKQHVEQIAPLPDATVVALIHKVRPRKRIMGARAQGEECPVEARGRVNIVMQPATPPPDAIENRFEAAFVDGRWWLLSFERHERDCSDLGAPNAFGCRALRGVE
jgi:hypothetical protein